MICFENERLYQRVLMTKIQGHWQKTPTMTPGKHFFLI